SLKEAMAKSKNQSASSTYAQLVRDQWSDYVKRFQPYDQRLIELATGQEDNIAAENMAREAATTGFGLADAAYRRDMSRMGVSLTPEERTAFEAQGLRDKAAATVGAVNGAR